MVLEEPLMELTEADELVKQLAVGFETLRTEYQKLHSQHQALENKLVTARRQYNDLAKLYGSEAATTPPLSLSSSPAREDKHVTISIDDKLSPEAAPKVKAANKAAARLRSGLCLRNTTESDGVKIWSGPSADATEAGNKALSSISESPLEQDFTIEGVPSKLGCPFAGMNKKRLSSHAASVLSRYRTDDRGAAPSAPPSSVGRLDRSQSQSRRSSRRQSFADPIRAEICGLTAEHEEEKHADITATKERGGQADGAETGVCPIRFLDQHSPEEVATYFENHKHELPRSHEVCVKRYQSNEKQIRELDAKYGNLVSMIQGLGAKHKDMLPLEPDEQESAQLYQNAESDRKVQKWAGSVCVPDADDQAKDVEAEERQSHFERPLREIRVGESPSRPWGIHVPAKYGDEHHSAHSSQPVRANPNGTDQPEGDIQPQTKLHQPTKCPFGFGEGRADAKAKQTLQTNNTIHAIPAGPDQNQHQHQYVDAHPGSGNEDGPPKPRHTFAGPVFFGFSADDAVKILRELGHSAP